MTTGEGKGNKQREIAQLYERHHAEMRQLANSILHDEEEAKDVVSDIFAWLVGHFSETQADQWRSYLLASVRHRCQDVIKHRQVQQKAQSSLMAENMVEQPLEESVHPDAIDVINYAERKMTPRTKKVFLMRYGENMTYREISDELGISIPAVYKHILQARHKITARFVGVILALAMMAIAVAIGIRWSQRQHSSPVSSDILPVENAVQVEDAAPSTPSVVVFENEELSQIIRQIADYYQVEAYIQDEKVGRLRLYFQWNQSESVDKVVQRLNHFSQIHITIESNHNLIVQ